MKKMINDMRNKLKEQKGATMVEYGIMVALIAVIVMAAVGPVGLGASAMFAAVAGAL